MRLVIYNKDKFTHKDVTFRIKGLILGGLVSVSIFLFWAFSFSAAKVEQELIPQEVRVMIIREHNEFSKEKLIQYMKELKIQHPHIVYGQFKLESGNFKHRRFTKNCNMLGMKRAGSRCTTAVGYDDGGFAIFNTWKEAVLDYCLWQSSFARGLTEKEYLQYLEVYCDESGYAQLVVNNSISYFSKK